MIRNNINTLYFNYFCFRFPLKGNTIASKAYVHKLKLDVNDSCNGISIGKRTQILNTTIFIEGKNYELFMGDGVRTQNSILGFQKNSNKRIARDRASIERLWIAVIENNHVITLGEDCMLSDDITIRNGDSPSMLNKAKAVRTDCTSTRERI